MTPETPITVGHVGWSPDYKGTPPLPQLKDLRPSAGLLFKDAQTMRTVRVHKKIADTWWCEGVDDDVGLWAYSEQFILSHSLLNAQEHTPVKTL